MVETKPLDWHEGSSPLNIVLVHPEIPQNTGSIGRLCVGTACTLHLIEPLGFDISEKRVRRAGLDYWKNVRLRVYPDLDTFFEEHRSPEHRFFSFSARGGVPHTSLTYSRGDFLLFGRETKGLPKDLLQNPPGPIANIPHLTGIRSLNLSNVVSIAVYEGLRQIFPEDF